MLKNLKRLSTLEQLLVLLAVFGSASLLLAGTGVWQVVGIYTLLSIPKIIPMLC